MHNLCVLYAHFEGRNFPLPPVLVLGLMGCGGVDESTAVPAILQGAYSNADLAFVITASQITIFSYDGAGVQTGNVAFNLEYSDLGSNRNQLKFLRADDNKEIADIFFIDPMDRPIGGIIVDDAELLFDYMTLFIPSKGDLFQALRLDAGGYGFLAIAPTTTPTRTSATAATVGWTVPFIPPFGGYRFLGTITVHNETAATRVVTLMDAPAAVISTSLAVTTGLTSAYTVYSIYTDAAVAAVSQIVHATTGLTTVAPATVTALEVLLAQSNVFFTVSSGTIPLPTS